MIFHHFTDRKGRGSGLDSMFVRPDTGNGVAHEDWLAGAVVRLRLVNADRATMRRLLGPRLDAFADIAW